MGKCDVKGPQIEVSTSYSNKNEKLARTTKETKTEQQRTKKITVNTENKSKNNLTNVYKNDDKMTIKTKYQIMEQKP